MGTYPFCQIKAKFTFYTVILDFIKNIHGDYISWQSYYLIYHLWDNYIKNKDEIEQLRKCEFGHQNIEQFTLFHYIRQEDRLEYFKRNETSRSSTIEDLLGVDAERKKQKSIYEKSRAVDKLYKQFDAEIKSKKARLVENNSTTEKNTEYAPLLDGKQSWDMETIFFGDSNPEKIRDSVIKALILLQKNPISVNDVELAYQNLKFIQQQKEKINLQEYLSVDFRKICNILDIEEDKELINAIAVLRSIFQKQSELQKALNNVCRNCRKC